MKYFVINSGSSSIKYQVIEMTTEAVLATGLVERIGEAVGRLKNTAFPGSSGQLGADSVDVHLASLGPDRLDNLLVKLVGGKNAHPGKTGLVEHAPSFPRQIGEIARVKPDAAQFMACPAQFAGHGNGVGQAAFEGVVGIDQ